MRRPALADRSIAALLGVLLGAALAVPAHAAEGHRSDLVNRLSLRVCADPANMPFSSEKGEGFENRIAEIVAAELKVPIEYIWFPQATGFIRQTLFAKRCDVVMGHAQGDELVLNTNAYYRSVYAPGAGSPLIDAGDPADGAGNDVGAVGAGEDDAADLFGRLCDETDIPTPNVADLTKCPNAPIIAIGETGGTGGGGSGGPVTRPEGITCVCDVGAASPRPGAALPKRHFQPEGNRRPRRSLRLTADVTAPLPAVGDAPLLHQAFLDRQQRLLQAGRLGPAPEMLFEQLLKLLDDDRFLRRRPRFRRFLSVSRQQSMHFGENRVNQDAAAGVFG